MALDLKQLKEFLNKAADSTNPELQEKAVVTRQEALQEQEDDEVMDADLQAKNTPQQNQNNVEIEDLLLNSAMPEMEEKDKEDYSTFGKGVKLSAEVEEKDKTDYSTFGKGVRFSYWDKLASAYIKDTKVEELPVNTKKDIERFSKPGKEIRVIEYGMVVSELLPKVDKYNFDQALEHIKSSHKGKSRKDLLDEFFIKARTKYILILNDKIIDGHHFLAKAKDLDITSSLKVIDLTPIRFQEKYASSLFDKLVYSYDFRNHSR